MLIDVGSAPVSSTVKQLAAAMKKTAAAETRSAPKLRQHLPNAKPAPNSTKTTTRTCPTTLLSSWNLPKHQFLLPQATKTPKQEPKPTNLHLSPRELRQTVVLKSLQKTRGWSFSNTSRRTKSISTRGCSRECECSSFPTET